MGLGKACQRPLPQDFDFLRGCGTSVNSTRGGAATSPVVAKLMSTRRSHSFGSILFPTDHSETSRAALPYALKLAQNFGAVLHILHVDVLHGAGTDSESEGEGHSQLLDALHSETGELLDHLVHAKRGRGVEVRRAQERDVAAAPAILRYCDEHDVDLIVMATHGRRGIRRLVLGSVAEEVVRYSNRPILTLRNDPQETAGRHILVPVDFSEVTSQVAHFAAAVAKMTNSTLELMHVIEVSYGPLVAEALPEIPEALPEELEAKAAQKLDELAESMHMDRSAIKTRVANGPVAHTILERIEQGDVGLVIVGGHGRTGMSRFLLGSVCERVVAQASCPVLTIKDPERQPAD